MKLNAVPIQTEQIGLILVVDASLPYCNSSKPNEVARNVGQYVRYGNTHQIILETVLMNVPSTLPVRLIVAGDGEPVDTGWLDRAQAWAYVGSSISLTGKYESCIGDALSLAYDLADSDTPETDEPQFSMVMAIINPYNAVYSRLPQRP